MPVYNGFKYLKQAIDSVLEQTFSDFEFLIINDGSTDTTADIVRSYLDKRVRLIDNGRNIGLIASLNKGIELAKGEYIARMDCDDICLPERFEKEVEYLEMHPEVCMVAAHVAFIDEQGNEIGHWREDMITKTFEQIKSFLPKENCIAHPTVMMRKSVIQPIGYNKSFKYSEDWGLWLMLLANGEKFTKLDTVLLKYRVHAEGTTVKVNTEGPRKKMIRFKFNYLKYRIGKLSLKNTDYKVLTSLIISSARYFFPGIYSFAGKIYSTRPLLFIQQFTRIKNRFNKNDKAISHIFFFPFYQAGGAEKVHAAIVETVADRTPIVIVTSSSGPSEFRHELEKSAEVYDVNQLLNWPFAKKWLTKKISSISNNQAILFGSNSRYYYELLADLPDGAKAIDLIHAFMHDYEDGSEKWSLPVVNKLRNRVVINQKTKKDLEELYKRHNIAPDLLDRVTCITNFTDRKEIALKEHGKLNVLFAGRGTEEKRVYLISHIARILGEKKVNIEFHFAGDVANAIPKEDLPYCVLHGVISETTEMDKLYAKAHITLITSSREGFPMTIMEAMMAGVVPISTNVGGISEHVQQNKTGILINNTTENEIVAEIVKALEHFEKNREELNSISVSAHEYAIVNLGKEKFVNAYKTLLGNNGL